jgi:type II secretory pathway pseudopilin PulG
MSKNGWTLTELVVVLAAAGVAAASLMSAGDRARESANRVACRANLQHWFFGLQLYANDYDGYYAGNVDWGMHEMFDTRSEWQKAMHTSMMDYERAEWMLCPSFKRGPDAPLDWIDKGTVPHGNWSMSSYWVLTGGGNHPQGCNAKGVPIPPTYGCIYNAGGKLHVARRGMNLSERTVMYMDKSWPLNGSKGCWTGQVGLDGTSNHAIDGANAVVQGPGGVKLTLAEGANALLCDGSVYWMNLTNGVYQYHQDYYRLFYVDEWVRRGQ